MNWSILYSYYVSHFSYVEKFFSFLKKIDLGSITNMYNKMLFNKRSV